MLRRAARIYKLQDDRQLHMSQVPRAERAVLWNLLPVPCRQCCRHFNYTRDLHPFSIIYCYLISERGDGDHARVCERADGEIPIILSPRTEWMSDHSFFGLWNIIILIERGRRVDYSSRVAWLLKGAHRSPTGIYFLSQYLPTGLWKSAKKINHRSEKRLLVENETFNGNINIWFSISIEK